MLDITRAMAISDYDCAERRAELFWLADQASRRRLIVEVGSYKGCTARAMAEHTPGTVYCVDTFEGSAGESEMRRLLDSKPPGWLESVFAENTRDLRNVVTFKLPSLDAASAIEASGRRADMIFLDASHDYDSVAADIRAWSRVLAPGGLLCGHDRQWDGVARAINELVPGHMVGVGAIWYRTC